MTSLHQSEAIDVLGRRSRPVTVLAPRRLRSRQAGWLVVQQGRAWITRDGDPDDHVLAAGQGVWLPAGAAAVIEPWHAGHPVRLDWQWAGAPGQRGARRGLGVADRAWLVLAEVLRATAGRLLAAARSAEAMASRAQGSIKAGDSIASCGAVQ